MESFKYLLYLVLNLFREINFPTVNYSLTKLIHLTKLLEVIICYLSTLFINTNIETRAIYKFLV